MVRSVTQARCVAGAPCWVSLMARDLATAQDFYGPLLGWRFEPGPDRWGPYCRAVADDIAVAGIGAVAQTWEFPVTWTTYFGTDDADRITAGVRERGGTTITGPLGFDAGRLALAADPAGAAFGVWQGRPGPASDLERPGALAWSELRTTDAFDAALFYGAVFGWDDAKDLDVEWQDDRVLLRGAGRTLAALHGGASQGAPEPRIRPRWHVFFSVADADATARRAEELGGSVAAAPHRSPFGRVAQLRDREGGLFWVVTPGDPSGPAAPG
jgi:predicted enzyme related to lactoylglutathione lyase